jgi:polyphosphate kinase 2 (PPK2 family)
MGVGRHETERHRVVRGALNLARAEETMSGKDYEQALKKLDVELVRLQEWVKPAGVKVCVVFEGRDGAGKGVCIKAITERVSPRVFRVVALPAPTEREKSQMYVQRSCAPAGGRRDHDLRPQLVQPRRGRTRAPFLY